MNRTCRYGAPLVFLAFCASLAPWLCDVPLNDDWAYALPVKRLLEQGRLVLSDWGASTQLMHLLGGALFAKVFGFSFAALRAYNLLIAAAAVFVFYRTLEEFDIPPADRLLAALAFCLNPLFLALANTFMTDATYLFWMLLSSYFYVRHLKEGRAAHLALAGLCAAAACLTRQLGVALPAAYTAVLALERRLTLKGALRVWVFPLAALTGYALWFKFAHGPTWASGNYVFSATLKHLLSPMVLAKDSMFRLFAALAETGMLLLPAAAGLYLYFGGFPAGAEAPAAPGKKQKGAPRKRPPTNRLTLIALALLAVFILLRGPLPYLENTFSRGGIGTLTVGPQAAKLSGLFAGAAFWGALTALAAAAAALLAGASAFALRGAGTPVRFLFLCALAHFAVSLAGAKFFDRYLLTLLPWFALAAALAAGRLKFSRPAAALALALVAGFGWAGMKDYFQWNSAKWELAARPRPGLDPSTIINGFDYEAWYNYERSMAYLKELKPLNMIDEWEWQKVTQYAAMVSFAPRPGFAVADTIEYDTPLSGKKGVLYLLRREDGPEPKQRAD